MPSPAYLPLDLCEAYVPLARKLGVSEVARSRAGFMGQYRRAQGDPNRLNDWWAQRRDNFVARHMAQVKARKEPLWRDGMPTRRHLALIMWAYSPTPERL